MKKISKSSLFILLLFVLLTSCSDTFKIEGNLNKLGNQSIRMLYATPHGVQDVWTVSKDNHFEFSGSTDELTLVFLFDAQSRMLGRFVLENGDDVEIKGNADAPFNIEVKSSDVNEDWYEFINNHAKDYENNNKTALDNEIEKYVARHPDELLSTLLLIVDYSRLNNANNVQQLLNKIDQDAKPESIIANYKKLTQRFVRPTSRLSSLLLYESTGDYSSFMPTTAQASILYLWLNSSNHSNEVNSLKTLVENHGAKLLVADVYVNPDTAVWRTLVKADGGKWKHYWAPEGPLNDQLKSLDMQSTPLFVVADSMGKIVYNGNNVAEARVKVNAILK